MLQWIVKGKKNELGQEVALIAEVFLNKEAVETLREVDLQKRLKQDINDATRELPLYKKIAEIEIREEEFVKTTTNKIKR